MPGGGGESVHCRYNALVCVTDDSLINFLTRERERERVLGNVLKYPLAIFSSFFFGILETGCSI